MNILDKLRIQFGAYAITVVTGLQIASWCLGHNGAVFTLTSAVIGAITGSILGFSIAKKA